MAWFGKWQNRLKHHAILDKDGVLMPLRKSVVIAPADLTRIFDELERRARSGDFLALRTRAFVYLLADGVLKTKAAVWLNAEEVVQDPSGKRIRVVQEAVQRPSEANQYRKRKILMTDRTREAIAEYLAVARSEGWFPHGRLKGPLWIATEHRGTLQRLSQRTAMAVWRKFLDEVIDEVSGGDEAHAQTAQAREQVCASRGAESERPRTSGRPAYNGTVRARDWRGTESGRTA